MTQFSNGLLICDDTGGMKYFSLADKDNPVIEDIVLPSVRSGQCDVLSDGTAVFRLQNGGLDKLQLAGPSIARVGRLEF